MPIRMMTNPNPDHGPGPAFLSRAAAAGVRTLHESLPEYAPTPLRRLDALADALGVEAVYVKDESKRFGLNAFKGLGGVYALYRVVCGRLGLEEVPFEALRQDPLRREVEQLVFVTATDGNHGRGIAWAAARLGCRAHVYLPKGSSAHRARVIRDTGMAEAVITELGYDDTVRYAAKMAGEHGRILVQDTSWPGYEEIPRTIIQGYTTMAEEAATQLEAAGQRPTHVFLQAGVGAMAGGVLGYLRNRCAGKPLIAAVAEPEEAACIFRSAEAGDGMAHPALGSGQTIMAGLNCAEPCTLTWPILRDQADFYFSCPDEVSVAGMRLLHQAGIVSGESGALTAGLAEMLSLEQYADMKHALGLGPDSVLLLFSTEGDTDPDAYRQIISGTRVEPAMDFTHHYLSPLGGITIASDGDGLTGLWFDGQKHFAQGLEARHTEKMLPVFEQTERWLDLYFSGRQPDFTPPLRLRGTAFRRAVWQTLMTVPFGQTVTYGQIAKKMGCPSARAVGGAAGHNPVSLIVPCHRAVGADGNLTGYAGGVARKLWLLTMEGADVSKLHMPRKPEKT